MNFFAGILEEVKVDCQAILTLWERQYDGWEEIIEFVLYERLLRYPSQHRKNSFSPEYAGEKVFFRNDENSHEGSPIAPLLHMCGRGKAEPT